MYTFRSFSDRVSEPYHSSWGTTRQRRLRARVLQVFGDKDVSWIHYPDVAWGLDRHRAPFTPHYLAAVSEPQLLRLMSALDDLATYIVPVWRGPRRGRLGIRLPVALTQNKTLRLEGRKPSP
jgi:hypothetical protein